MAARTSKELKEKQHCPLFWRPEMTAHRRAVLRLMQKRGHKPAVVWSALGEGSSYCAEGYVKTCTECGMSATLYLSGAYIDENGAPQVPDWSAVCYDGSALDQVCRSQEDTRVRHLLHDGGDVAPG